MARRRSRPHPIPLLPISRRAAAGEQPAARVDLVRRSQRGTERDRPAAGRPACRLLTLLGPGGISKTRLAQAVAAAHTAAFPDGGAFVPLAAISMPKQIIPPSARRFGSHLLGIQTQPPTCSTSCASGTCCSCWIASSTCWREPMLCRIFLRTHRMSMS
jgi:hypothetical protein